MSLTVYLALLGWPLVAMFLCARLPPRRAVIAAYVAAWLFLPVAKFELPGLPDWTKISATSVSLLFGLMIFDFDRLTRFRPTLIDLPMATWCLSAIASSLVNGLGLYDGVSAALTMIVTWGLPYFLGRLYLGEPDGLRDLAVAIFIGGLVYVPFCLYEIRMSPQLHNMVYGFIAQGFEHAHRFGGWRPAVFMMHGLMVGMWMAMATLAGVWLWTSGNLRSLLGLAMPWWLLALGGTTILVKSVGSIVLLMIGLGYLALLRLFPSRWPLFALALVVPLYIVVRVSGLWSGSEMVEAARLIDAERAASVETRLTMEDLLSAKAMQQPLLGWGGWGRGRVRDDTGRDISITDGLWIIVFGSQGLVGLVSMFAVFLVPLIGLIRRLPPEEWIRTRFAPAACLAVVIVLYLMDCIANAMVSPIYPLAAGGLCGALVAPVRGTERRVETNVSESSRGSSAYPGPPSGPPTPVPESPPRP